MKDLKIEKQGQEFTAFAFRLDDKGKVRELSGDEKSFVSLLKYISPEATDPAVERRFLETFYGGDGQ